ncbi:MAG: CBS domain-containing protein [Rhodocyclaceae bacterium]|nr:CBS domain-containing protein [Rhodocyclaceae bacterium]
MLISDVMTRKVRIASPDQSLQQAAEIMAAENIGCLPVGENDRLVGMITDRDIAVRAVAQAKAPDTTKVREAMSADVKYCYDDDSVSSIAGNMGDIQLHRLPVVNHDKRLVGIVAVADLANYDGPDSAARAICGISGD